MLMLGHLTNVQLTHVNFSTCYISLLNGDNVNYHLKNLMTMLTMLTTPLVVYINNYL